MAVLLLTSTIAPDPGALLLSVADPVRRLAEYDAALRTYAGLVPSTFRAVVYADNSPRAGLGPIERIGADLGLPLEVLRTPPTPPVLGRGEGEAQLIDAAMASSRTLAGMPADELVWKVTGRYVVRNLAGLVARTTARGDLHINVRRWPSWWADTHVYAFTRHGYEQALSAAARERNGCGGGEPPPREMKMARAVRGMLATGEVDVVPRLGREPRVTGVRGMDGRPYDSPRQRAKWAARTTARRVAPRLWV